MVTDIKPKVKKPAPAIDPKTLPAEACFMALVARALLPHSRLANHTCSYALLPIRWLMCLYVNKILRRDTAQEFLKRKRLSDRISRRHQMNYRPPHLVGLRGVNPRSITAAFNVLPKPEVTEEHVCLSWSFESAVDFKLLAEQVVPPHVDEDCFKCIYAPFAESDELRYIMSTREFSDERDSFRLVVYQGIGLISLTAETKHLYKLFNIFGTEQGERVLATACHMDHIAKKEGATTPEAKHKSIKISIDEIMTLSPKTLPPKQTQPNRPNQQNGKNVGASRNDATKKPSCAAPPSMRPSVDALESLELVKQMSTIVLVDNLESRPSANRRLGRVVTPFQHMSGRAGIQMLDSKERLFVKASKLMPIEKDVDLTSQELVDLIDKRDVPLLLNEWGLPSMSS